MRVLVARAPGELVADEAPVPPLGPGQVLVRTKVSAVSAGTEQRMLYGRSGDPLSMHPGWPAVGGFGYLAAGDVVELGEGVDGVRVGERVSCGRVWGAHRELVDVDAASVVALPEGLSYLEGACSYWAVPPLCGIFAGQPRLYDDVAVIGLGPLGLAAVQLLAPFARRVVAIDRVAARCAAAERFGALGVDASATDPRQAVGDLLPDGPGVVLELAGAQPALELALDIVRPLGRVALVGVLPPLQQVDLFWPMQVKGVQLVPMHRPGGASPEGGGEGSPRQAYLPLVLDMIARGRLDLRGLCSWVVPWDRAPEAMELLHRRPDRCLGLAFAWEPEQVDGMSAYQRALAGA